MYAKTLLNKVMLMLFNRSIRVVNENMGEVRVKVKLTNPVDEILVNRGLLNPTQLRL